MLFCKCLWPVFSRSFLYLRSYFVLDTGNVYSFGNGNFGQLGKVFVLLLLLLLLLLLYFIIIIYIIIIVIIIIIIIYPQSNPFDFMRLLVLIGHGSSQNETRPRKIDFLSSVGAPVSRSCFLLYFCACYPYLSNDFRWWGLQLVGATRSVSLQVSQSPCFGI